MRPLQFFVAAVTALPLIAAAQIDGLAACGQTCHDDLVAKGASIGCPGGDAACLCNNQNYRDGIDACVNQLCGNQGVDPVSQLNIVHSFCSSLQSQTPGAVPTPTPQSPSPSPPPSDTPIPTPTPTTDPTTPATSATDGPSSQEAPLSPSPSAATEQTPPPTPTPSSSDATSQPSTSNTSTSPGETNTATAEPVGNSNDNNHAASDTADSGLPVGAKIGIGVGVGVGAVLAILGVVIVMMRRRRYTPRGRKISGPGSEYDSRPPRLPQAFYEKNTSDLEMTSRRYEDMLPRQQPRQMV